MTFTATNKAPGVYIDEVRLPGPIPGVGTSTAAFVGPAQQGPLNTPVLLTNLTEFKSVFGSYVQGTPVFVTHAVSGLFQNGGSECYFVRVGTGALAALDLADHLGRTTLTVTAQKEGVAGNTIKVQVKDDSIVSAVAVYRSVVGGTDIGVKTAAAGGVSVVLNSDADAQKFIAGDSVLLTSGGNSETAKVASVSADTLTLLLPIAQTYTGGTIRIADIVPGQTALRVAATKGIEAGSILRLTQNPGGAGHTEDVVVSSVDRINSVVYLATGLVNTYALTAAADPVTIQTVEFTLIVQTPAVEQYPTLSMDPRHSRYFGRIVSSGMVTVALPATPSPTVPPANRPKALAATALAGGADDDLGGLTAANFTAGIDALTRVTDANILVAPDSVNSALLDGTGTRTVQNAMIAQCEALQDRFAVLDMTSDVAVTTVTPEKITAQRNQYDSDAGYAAMYFPWITIPNPTGAGTLQIPPSGHIAGVYANVDSARGVFKAPANEVLHGVLSLTQTLNDGDQGPLNEIGVNVLRAFPGAGIRIWGARTIAPVGSTQWRYVNVRRLVTFIEKSIQEGTRFAVFEPNNLSLWQQVKRQVTDFLTRVWSDGALFGATADLAFRVRVDAELNPPATIALGQLVIEVVLYPTTPAEFVVFRIIQQPGGPVVQE